MSNAKDHPKFAFIIHPVSLEDIFRKFKFMRRWPRPLVENFMKRIPPLKVSEITGVKSSHAETSGYFVSVNLTSEQMVALPENYTINKIIKAGKLAEKLGARITGLGAMTSVVGDAGVTVARNLDIPVTTGNTFTIATALEGTEKAAEKMGIDLDRAECAVIGATGSIGSACAEILAQRGVRYLTLMARDKEKLDQVADRIYKNSGVSAKVTSRIKETLPKADMIVAVSGSEDALVDAGDLKSGAVVCDVARPRDVSVKVARERNDVLVIEGGVVEVPGDVEFNFNFGFPPKTAYACMAETMILALERKWEPFTLGREIRIDKVNRIVQLAHKHGFKLAGFRSFERAVSNEEIAEIKKRAGR